MRLRVGHLWTQIEEPKDWLLDRIERATRYMLKGVWFSPSYRRGHWDGFYKLLDRKKLRFPSGLLDKVMESLGDAGEHLVMLDERSYDAEPNPAYELPDGTKLRDYQCEALDAALCNYRGTIELATAGGKSLLGGAIIHSLGVPTLWLTHRLILAHQTRRALAKALGRKIGFVGDGVCDIQDITIAMVQTMDRGSEKLAAFYPHVKLLIADEIHHVASQSQQWYENLSKIEAPYRFGLTATPDFRGHGMKLLAQTGPVIYRVTAAELIARGYLVAPSIWIAEAPAAQIAKTANYASAYKFGIVENLQRNQLIAEMAEVMKAEKKPLLVLVRQISHGYNVLEELRRKNITADFIHGNVKEPQRDLVLAALRDGLIDCVVAQVEILGEGADLPWLRAVVNATGNSGGDAEREDGGRAVVQILGRALRTSPGKTEALIFDFIDLGHKTLARASAARMSAYEAQGHTERVNWWFNYGTSRPSQSGQSQRGGS